MQWVHDPGGRSGCYPELTSFGSVVVGLLQIHRDFQQSTETTSIANTVHCSKQLKIEVCVDQSKKGELLPD